MTTQQLHIEGAVAPVNAPNWENRTIFTGDNLEVLRRMNTGSVDLVYLDPPFNSKKQWNAPIGSKGAQMGFKDTWTLSDIDLQWHDQLEVMNPALHDVIRAARHAGGDSTMSYLLMMSVRLLELHRVLKPTGSIYLHCDDAESHGLKLMMDTIFGRDKFRNEIIWKRHSGHYGAGYYGRITDRLLFYGDCPVRDEVALPVKETRNKKHTDERGEYYLTYIQGPGISQGKSGEEWRGWSPTKFGRHWAVPTARLKDTYGEWIAENVIPGYEKLDDLMDRLDALDGAGMIVWTSTGNPQIKRYTASRRRLAPPDLWDDIVGIGLASKEKVGYPTQKPLSLLERIIKASSNEGDVVLDPFCGCATTAVAAEELGRQWVGIDYSDQAYKLVEERLEQRFLEGKLDLYDFKVIQRFADPAHPKFVGPLERTDLGSLPPYKSHKSSLYVEQDGHCNLCGMWFDAGNLSVDHIIPRKHGGTDHRDNLQLLCRACNSKKGERNWESVKADYFAGRRQR